jgi:hypothetical protein
MGLLILIVDLVLYKVLIAVKMQLLWEVVMNFAESRNHLRIPLTISAFNVKMLLDTIWMVWVEQLIFNSPYT